MAFAAWWGILNLVLTVALLACSSTCSTTSIQAAAIRPVEAGLRPYRALETSLLSRNLASIAATMRMTMMEGVTSPMVAMMAPGTPPTVKPT